MGTLAYRIVAGLLIVLGAALFAYMMQVSYGTSAEWDRRLFALGMPLSFLLPAVAALMVAVGCAMLSYAWRAARMARRRENAPK
ncbi:MAG TPA: hypothetical protein VFW47_18210 [Phenylobacterium sp.]|nr:hypothetical protein [Phenylobacterium sp.]